MAGKDWLTSFLQRNNTLSIRRPQATSMSHSTSFNRTNVSSFFKNLQTVLARYLFEAKDIWNVDETGTTTVQVPGKIIATKGKRQVGAVTSGESGTLVTIALAVNAQGNCIPPYFIFPRKKFQDHFVMSGPIGSTGSANSSGWMHDVDFLSFLQHFVRHTRVNLESKVLLLLDNHWSHLSVAAIDFCRSNGIVLLSFPPYCSHRLQPLDRSVFGPLKRYVNTAADHWMRTHHGKMLTIYDIPNLVAKALPRAATPSNIRSGFVCTGICPFNPDIFEEQDFSPSYVTNRPDPSQVPCALTPHCNTDPYSQSLLPEYPAGSTRNTCLVSAILDHPAVCSAVPPEEAGRGMLEVSHTSVQAFSPEPVRSFPKAGPRKDTKRGGKRRSTAILTDSPVRAALEEEQQKRIQKKPPAPKKRLLTPHTQNTAPTNTAPTDSSDKDEECLVCKETFSSSLPGEVWVQCLFCQLWSHKVCTEGAEHYICHNCDHE
ncbi:uncharacterized protein LOC143712127 isoform X1 [Siphateles boraxobius]